MNDPDDRREPFRNAREERLWNMGYAAGADAMRERAAKVCEGLANAGKGFRVADFECGSEALSCSKLLRLCKLPLTGDK